MGKNKNRGTVIANVSELNLDGLTVDIPAQVQATEIETLQLPVVEVKAEVATEVDHKNEAKIAPTPLAALKPEVKTESEIKAKPEAEIDHRNEAKVEAAPTPQPTEFDVMLAALEGYLTPENIAKVLKTLSPVLGVAKALVNEVLVKESPKAVAVRPTMTADEAYYWARGIKKPE